MNSLIRTLNARAQAEQVARFERAVVKVEDFSMNIANEIILRAEEHNKATGKVITAEQMMDEYNHTVRMFGAAL